MFTRQYMDNTAKKVLEKIVESGYEAYIVGGYPRDFYIGRNSTDYDICTNATPKNLKKIFGDALLPQENYGSVTLFSNNIRFEITTYRKDITYSNNRKPIQIEYVDSLLEDLKRRDFTMNTMCMDVNGTLIDLLNGKEDIDKKVVRVVGDPFVEMEEDVLRILRAVRFATILDFKIDSELEEAIKKNAYLLKNLSYYRKKEELDKIFSSTNVKYGLELIKKYSLAEPLELSNLDSIVPTTYLLGIWAQLDVLDIYDFNKAEKETIKKVNELLNGNILDNGNLYKYGLYISTIAGEIKGIDKVDILKCYNELYIHTKDEIAIKPLEICKITNRKPGSFLKQILNDIEDKIVKKELSNNYNSIAKYVEKNYK